MSLKDAPVAWRQQRLLIQRFLSSNWHVWRGKLRSWEWTRHWWYSASISAFLAPETQLNSVSTVPMKVSTAAAALNAPRPIAKMIPLLPKQQWEWAQHSPGLRHWWHSYRHSSNHQNITCCCRDDIDDGHLHQCYQQQHFLGGYYDIL